MSRARTFLERIRHTFWIPPAVAVALFATLGVALPSIDKSIELPAEISFNGGAETARSLLQTIVTLGVSIAGISFSVIVVALVLASQQLSPRVLRSFQRNPLNQAVLGVFLGTAIYAICVLSAVNDDPADPVPEASVSLAMIFAGVALALFVVFLHHVLRSLNASAVIRRIAAEGHQALEEPYPRAAGCSARDEEAAEQEFTKATNELSRTEIRSPRAGYLATVKATQILDVADSSDLRVEQLVAIGDFVVTGGPLAAVWSAEMLGSDLKDEICAAFVLNEERIVDHDVAFPIRQLADVALKGLSPGINDPTTSENAMDSVTDSLVRIAKQDWGTRIRLDGSGTPRLRATRPTFDQLVRLGFDQVRRDAAKRPSFSVRLLELLAELREHGGPTAAASTELQRQADLIREHAADTELRADRAMIQECYAQLHDCR